MGRESETRSDPRNAFIITVEATRNRSWDSPLASKALVAKNGILQNCVMIPLNVHFNFVTNLLYGSLFISSTDSCLFTYPFVHFGGAHGQIFIRIRAGIHLFKDIRFSWSIYLFDRFDFFVKIDNFSKSLFATFFKVPCLYLMTFRKQSARFDL